MKEKEKEIYLSAVRESVDKLIAQSKEFELTELIASAAMAAESANEFVVLLKLIVAVEKIIKLEEELKQLRIPQ